MAEGVAFSFLGKLAERMVDPIVRQFSYLFYYNSNIENLEQVLKGLQAARDGVKLQVVAAEHNLETIDPAMQSWLDQVCEIERKASTVIELKAKGEQMCMNVGCCNAKQHYLLSRKAAKLIDVIGKHRSDGDKYGKSTHSPHPPGIVTGDSLTPELPTRIAFSQSEEFESRKLIVELVMEALKDDGIRMIGICGIGGVGKTTMANEVCRRAKEQALFEEFAMTSVSQTQDLPKIQKELARMLGLSLDDGDTILLRAQRLRERLSNGRKILVILDDVWQELSLQEVGIPMDGIKCKVMCTSRNKDALSDMGAHRFFDVGVLNPQESWDLFKANAWTFDDRTDRYPNAKKIVAKSGGLPIAIVTLAKALKNKEKHVWDDALHHLEESTGEKIRGMAEHVYKCIEMSYIFLKDSGARTLLLFCCLFPEDANMEIQHLVDFKDILPALGEATEDGVRTIVGDLISRNLLVTGMDEDCVKVHDVVREVCLSIEGLNKLGRNCEPSSIGTAKKTIICRKKLFYEEAGSQAFKQVMDALADDQICTIRIVGVGLIDLFFDEVIKKVKKDNLFDDVALTTSNLNVLLEWTRDMCLVEMQCDIARKLGLATVMEETSITENAKQLRLRLTNGRRSLIIIQLDDEWCGGFDHLDKIGIPVGAEDNKGCKVVLGRFDHRFLLERFDQRFLLGSEKIVVYDGLSNEESLVLLKEHARFNGELDFIAKQIVEKCGGEPLPIVCLGEALKNQNKNTWLDVLHQLEDSPSYLCKSFPIEYSYNVLSGQAKSLYMLIAIMEQEVGIPIEKLVVVSERLNLFEDIKEGDLEATNAKAFDLLQDLYTRLLIDIDVNRNTACIQTM